MANQKQSVLVSEKILPKIILDENAKALDFYRTYQKIADILEKMDI